MFKKKFQAILKALGYDSTKSAEWTQETWDEIAKSYEEKHGTTMTADMAAEKAQADKAATAEAILAIVNKAEETTPENDNTEGKDGGASSEKTEVTLENLAETVGKVTTELDTVKKESLKKDETIATLSQKVEAKTPEAKVTGASVPFQMAHTATHAFGIDHPMFSMEQRHNKIAANANFAKANPIGTTEASELEETFLKELKSFGRSVAGRYKELHNSNMIGQIKSAAFDVDYTELDSLMKNQYVVRRTDALISQILQIPTIFDMFPRRYGVQDYDVITNVLFDEVSAAWQSGKIFKGDADLQPETGHVDDATIKVKFEPLTQLERSYVGYLNKEGSGPIKWSMIEWYTLELLTKAVQEQNRRYVRGIYYKPETGVAGSYLNASTGLLNTLLRYQHQYKLLPLDSTAYRSYTKTTMFASIKEFLDDVDEVLEDQEMDDFVLVLNKRHKSWFIENLRTEFGSDNDFMGTKEGTMLFPDFDVPIYWLPSQDRKDFTVILTKPGNLQCIEYMPGEMMAVVFEPDFEDVLVRSRWKEGFSAAFVGKNFDDKATLVANDYYQQQIFVNKAVSELAADETAPDAANGYRFLTVDNAAATEILTIDNAKKGVGYYIEIGGTPTNPSNITKALEFSEITADWTPTAVGDYILVVLNDAGDKFLELERMVAGVRAVNKALQSTLPESRS